MYLFQPYTRPTIKMPMRHSEIMLELEGKSCLSFDEASSATFLIRIKPIKRQNFHTENLRESWTVAKCSPNPVSVHQI